MKQLGIIPARYASSRFPGKPLADIAGKPMIRWVYENVNKAIDMVYVATDDVRIFDAVKEFGGNCIMTSEKHPRGTDRCAEAATKAEQETGQTFDVVVNIQGDEPLIAPQQIKQLTNCFDANTELATLIHPIGDTQRLFNPNNVKVVLDAKNNALLFSRSAIPHIRGEKPETWLSHHTFYQHVGMYGYRRDILQEITQLRPSQLEQAESLEQLRWLDNGFSIRCALTDTVGIGVDTPADLQQILELIQKNNPKR